MRIHIFALRDSKVRFLCPFFAPNEEAAVRNVEHDVQTSGSLISSHTSDFDLFKLGEFDDESGVISALETPQFVVSGSSIWNGLYARSAVPKEVLSNDVQN